MDSLAYVVYDTKRKLKHEYVDADPKRLVALKKAGVEITDLVFDRLVTYVGDSTMDTYTPEDERNAKIFDSKVVLLETTFLAPEDRQKAKDRGHTEWSELIEFLAANHEKWRTEKFILKHFSLKTDMEELKSRLAMLHIFHPTLAAKIVPFATL